MHVGRYAGIPPLKRHGMAAFALAVLLLPSVLVAQTPGSGGNAEAPRLRLVGVVMIRETGDALATIEEPRTRRQALYRVGDAIGEARLVRILEEDRAVLVVDGTEVELRLAGIPNPERARGSIGPGRRAGAGIARRCDIWSRRASGGPDAEPSGGGPA